MKLGTREAKAHLARPDAGMAATLITGEDAVRVAEARATLLAAILGPGGEAEMRLDRIGGADLRRDPAALLDAALARGFFPGPRAVWVEDATDGLAPAVAAALDAIGPGDARVVVTGAGLAAKGALRKLFEGRRGVAAITLYDDPPTEAEVSEMLRQAGLTRIEPDAREVIGGLAQTLPPGDLRQLVERLALHELDATGRLEAATVMALAPSGGEAEVDDLLVAVFDGRRTQVPLLLAVLAARGVGPVTVAIQTQRHLRAILSVASDLEGPSTGIGRLRPPVGGPRRDAILRAAKAWRRERLEDGLQALMSLDLALRSGGAPPAQALLERALMRLASPG